MKKIEKWLLSEYVLTNCYRHIKAYSNNPLEWMPAESANVEDMRHAKGHHAKGK